MFQYGPASGPVRNLGQCYERWQHILKVLRQREQARAQAQPQAEAQAEARVKVEAERKAWVQAVFNHGPTVKVNVDELLKPDAPIAFLVTKSGRTFLFVRRSY